MALKYQKTQPLVAKHAEIAIKVITWMPWALPRSWKRKYKISLHSKS
jgi:hypothetical protein